MDNSWRLKIDDCLSDFAHFFSESRTHFQVDLQKTKENLRFLAPTIETPDENQGLGVSENPFQIYPERKNKRGLKSTLVNE